jgi:hypothetical protein
MLLLNNVLPQDENHAIRIQPFMSSTFKAILLFAPCLTHSRQLTPCSRTIQKDFTDERRHLRERVFPELQHYAAQRGGTFSPIDLVWGISKSQSSSGKVSSQLNSTST